ncbi:MAG: hypothetical protein Q4P20_06330 [Eubacteriales bacterium]|nr:hypothetical protein [Eubacteriales bacterium]
MIIDGHEHIMFSAQMQLEKTDAGEIVRGIYLFFEQKRKPSQMRRLSTCLTVIG